ncbi:MAG: hypothetical protein LBT19_01280 [Candidatus Nomurabacteria bacterium]|nr:hypothetical protein [Candidatus Nomurabacteria bacterium]
MKKMIAELVLVGIIAFGAISGDQIEVGAVDSGANQVTVVDSAETKTVSVDMIAMMASILVVVGVFAIALMRKTARGKALARKIRNR